MEIVEVGIVFRRWRRWKGITVVRVGIFCTFLKIPVFLLLHPRAVVVVVVIVAGIDVVRTAIIVVVAAVHIVHAYIANSPANNIVLTIAPTSVMVVVMVTHIMATATSSTDIIR